MILSISNVPRPYKWGSRSLLPEFLRRVPSGEPEAELWFGAHPQCPSRIVAPGRIGGHKTLDTWIAADPLRALGPNRDSDDLPFMMKVLGIERELSIQVHPDIEQARSGFESENRARIPIEHSTRTYRDPRPKPEFVTAIGGSFEALIGFRPLDESRALVRELISRTPSTSQPHKILMSLLDDLVGPPDQAYRRSVGRSLNSKAGPQITEAVSAALRSWSSLEPLSNDLQVIADISASRPGDPGVTVGLLLNRVRLSERQGVYVPPGTVHSYLNGLAVEVLAASDNVVRCGFSDKHIDPRGFVSTASFEPSLALLREPKQLRPGIATYQLNSKWFSVLTVRTFPSLSCGDTVPLELSGPAIALAVEGTVLVSGKRDKVQLEKGGAVFVTPDETVLTFSGKGEIVLATVGDRSI